MKTRPWYHRRLPCLLALFSAGIAACSSEGSEPEERSVGHAPPASVGAVFSGIDELPSPAGPGSVTPYLSPGADGEIYLSWQEPVGSGHAIRMSVLHGSSWSEPRTITHGGDFFVNWADFPSIIELPDGSLAAHWLQREGPGTYAYGVRISRSLDGGLTWSEPVTPHLDGTETEHGFVSLFPGDAGRLAAVWLDGRAFAEAKSAERPSAADSDGDQAAERNREPPDADMSLRFAEIGGEITSEWLLDARACDCCQTSAALTSSGPILVYRDRSDTEIRDISIVRHVSGEWTEPATVHRDGWHIPACPVNGPAASALDKDVVVAWFTAAGEEPRVQIAFSADAGASFGEPLRIDEGDALGRVDIALLRDGSALVTWLATIGEGAAVFARRVRADGAMSDVATAGQTDGNRSSGFPRMALREDDVILAWTDTAGEGAVRTAVATLAAE
jgi:hypothetical protein